MTRTNYRTLHSAPETSPDGMVRETKSPKISPVYRSKSHCFHPPNSSERKCYDQGVGKTRDQLISTPEPENSPIIPAGQKTTLSKQGALSLTSQDVREPPLLGNVLWRGTALQYLQGPKQRFLCMSSLVYYSMQC